ncbi:MAG: arginine--tRNA ligase, partial [bacterium]|nr:arginine--tRNA ligase [bacterium]
AGPGFLNFRITTPSLEAGLMAQIGDPDRLGLPQLDQSEAKTIVIDFSAPNIAKPMGVHHLLSTIIGQAINNLLKTCGYKVIRDNYVGDWGTQYGKLTVAIQKWGDMEKIKKNPIPELLNLYVKFHDQAEKDPGLEDQGRAAFKKLEEKDLEITKLWQWIREISLEECQKLWARLGAEFDCINSESFYEDKMQPIIAEGLKTGVITEGQEGALIIEMDDPNKPPAIIRKKDGATLYATRDLARVKYWQDELKGSLGINVVDIAQKLYFEQLFEAAHKMGFTKMQQVHIDFGRMEFPEGGMSTRKGKVILLEEVLDEAEKQALKKIKDHSSELPEDEQKELARKLGLGAIKYNVLSQSRNKNYSFDWDQMLSFEGNSAPYLQYAYTRTQSILRKAAEAGLKTDLAVTASLAVEEKELLKKLLEFEEAIQRSTEEYKPNLLCSYLFETAQAFSTFYNNLRVLDAETAESISTRLKLVEAAGTVLKKGLGLLGIEVPERM